MSLKNSSYEKSRVGRTFRLDMVRQLAYNFDMPFRFTCLVALILFGCNLMASTPADMVLSVFDKPDDDGTSLVIRWKIPDFDSSTQYFIQQSITGDTDVQVIYTITVDSGEFTKTGLDPQKSYEFRLVTKNDSEEKVMGAASGVKPVENWFNKKRINVLVGVMITGLLIGFFVIRGKRGMSFFIRPIAGLQAVDEAIGRATEMGKPILYSAGRGTITRPATIASMNILGSVIQKVAEYNTPLIFPNNDPVVMTVAQEVAYESYNRAGHPENFRPENIFFVTDSQFGYAAAVDGIMLRYKPATNLFFGTFEAESLILAETGNSVGAMQIAGTDSSIQMSFFIVSCDYVLIGEELFAASGYLSRDQQVLGSIKGSDYAKLLIILFMIAAIIMVILGNKAMMNWLTIR